MTARVRWRHLARLAMLLAVAGLLIPDGGVHATTISLTKVESAKSVDFAEGVVWILVLGSDADPGEDVLDGRSDAIQLVGTGPPVGTRRRHRHSSRHLSRDPGSRPRPDQRRHAS